MNTGRGMATAEPQGPVDIESIDLISSKHNEAQVSVDIKSRQHSLDCVVSRIVELSADRKTVECVEILPNCKDQWVCLKMNRVKKEVLHWP